MNDFKPLKTVIYIIINLIAIVICGRVAVYGYLPFTLNKIIDSSQLIPRTLTLIFTSFLIVSLAKELLRK